MTYPQQQLHRTARSGRQRDTSQRSHRQRRRRVHIAVVLGILLILGAAASSWLAFRAEQIRVSLTDSQALIVKLQTELTEGESSADSTLHELQNQTSRARVAATDPLWRAAGFVPFLGNNFSTITEVAVSADDVVNGAVTPLLTSFRSFDWNTLQPVNGRIDVTSVERVAPQISAAANTVRLSHQRLSNIETSSLVPQVREPLEQAIGALERASESLDGAAAAAQLIPPMLGSESPREYLVLIQNNAEVRATGGISGAVAVMTVDGGEMKLSAQGSASEMGRFDPAVILDAEQASIYTSRVGRFLQSVNLTPDFPTAAETAAEMWELQHADAEVDGVVALDPVVLAHILEASGPVELTLDDQSIADSLALTSLPTSLTADNVVSTLLSDVYAQLEDPKLQDEYFAAVATKVFSALSSGDAQQAGMVGSLIRSANEGRLYVWSAHSDEELIIAPTKVGGSMTKRGVGGAAFGAYFNDGTGGKMDYYVRRTVQLQRECTADGLLQYTLKATLTNAAPADAAESLPAYVTGGGAFGVPAGSVQTNFVGYGPEQAQLQTARVNGEPVPLGSHRHGGRPVGLVTTTLAPGQTATVEVDFSNVIQQSEPELDVTPTIQPISEVVMPLEGDGACE